jgi:uncharacterized protein (DUF58 family)
MSDGRRRVFPLVPRRRFAGAPFGTRRSPRRGTGDEIAGFRSYHVGDHIARIDWKASARLSAARGADEFVVREFFAEESVRVVLLCDLRPGLALYESGPWLDKADAVRTAGGLIAASATAAGAELAYLDVAGGAPFWLPLAQNREAQIVRRLRGVRFGAPPNGLDLALYLLRARAVELTLGSFVFVVSDFLAPIEPTAWRKLREPRWDVVPVVVQDPLWEQSFPDVGGVVVPFADPVTGRLAPTRLSRRAARTRRAENEARLERLLGRFGRLGLDPLLISSAEPGVVETAFGAWARRRLLRLRRSA